MIHRRQVSSYVFLLLLQLRYSENPYEFCYLDSLYDAFEQKIQQRKIIGENINLASLQINPAKKNILALRFSYFLCGNLTVDDASHRWFGDQKIFELEISFCAQGKPAMTLHA